MFRAFIMKRIVAQVLAALSSEPGTRVVIKETSRKIIKAEVTAAGAKRFSIHKRGTASTGRKVWKYTTYDVNDSGEYYALHSGQYPYDWED